MGLPVSEFHFGTSYKNKSPPTIVFDLRRNVCDYIQKQNRTVRFQSFQSILNFSRANSLPQLCTTFDSHKQLFYEKDKQLFAEFGIPKYWPNRPPRPLQICTFDLHKITKNSRLSNIFQMMIDQESKLIAVMHPDLNSRSHTVSEQNPHGISVIMFVWYSIIFILSVFIVRLLLKFTNF
jgi:hypothetical protein